MQVISSVKKRFPKQLQPIRNEKRSHHITDEKKNTSFSLSFLLKISRRESSTIFRNPFPPTQNIMYIKLLFSISESQAMFIALVLRWKKLQCRPYHLSRRSLISDWISYFKLFVHPDSNIQLLCLVHVAVISSFRFRSASFDARWSGARYI